MKRKFTIVLAILAFFLAMSACASKTTVKIDNAIVKAAGDSFYLSGDARIRLAGKNMNTLWQRDADTDEGQPIKSDIILDAGSAIYAAGKESNSRYTRVAKLNKADGALLEYHKLDLDGNLKDIKLMTEGGEKSFILFVAKDDGVYLQKRSLGFAEIKSFLFTDAKNSSGRLVIADGFIIIYHTGAIYAIDYALSGKTLIASAQNSDKFICAADIGGKAYAVKESYEYNIGENHGLDSYYHITLEFSKLQIDSIEPYRTVQFDACSDIIFPAVSGDCLFFAYLKPENTKKTFIYKYNFTDDTSDISSISGIWADSFNTMYMLDDGTAFFKYFNRYVIHKF